MGDDRDVAERVAVLEKGAESLEDAIRGLRKDMQQLSQNLLSLSQSLLKAWPPEAAKLFALSVGIIGALSGLAAAFFRR